MTLPAGGRGIDQNGDGRIDGTEGSSAARPRSLLGSADGLRQTVGREVVVKILHPERLHSAVTVRRFPREAQLASRLDHPYAAHVYAFGIEERDKLLWIAMERVQGVTFAEWLMAHRPMPLGQFVPFFERIAVVVQTAHDRGIVHRDLKPSNVMVLERAGELLPKLPNFGVAKLLDGAVPLESMPDVDYQALLATDHLPARRPVDVRTGKSTVTDPNAPPLGSSLTPNNHTVGSPAYIAPEQWDHAVAVAKRPQDRWDTALELAGALRAASGIGASSADLPRIDAGVRDAWLAGAPQPLAESVAVLDSARNAHQATSRPRSSRRTSCAICSRWRSPRTHGRVRAGTIRRCSGSSGHWSGASSAPRSASGSCAARAAADQPARRPSDVRAGRSGDARSRRCRRARSDPRAFHRRQAGRHRGRGEARANAAHVARLPDGDVLGSFQGVVTHLDLHGS